MPPPCRTLARRVMGGLHEMAIALRDQGSALERRSPTRRDPVPPLAHSRVSFRDGPTAIRTSRLSLSCLRLHFCDPWIHLAGSRRSKSCLRILLVVPRPSFSRSRISLATSRLHLSCRRVPMTCPCLHFPGSAGQISCSTGHFSRLRLARKFFAPAPGAATRGRLPIRTPLHPTLLPTVA